MTTESKAINAVQLIQDFFSPPRVTMDEFKALSKEERAELADAIAKKNGLTKQADGKYIAA